MFNRRQLFRVDFRSRLPVRRPPWAIAEGQFLDRCNGCGDCRDACTQRIVILADGGYPQIDFLNDGCTFCGDCARACTQGALAYSPHVAPWQLKAVATRECLTRHGVVCRSCSEQCETGAIRFISAKGVVAQPRVEPTLCTGCGACVSVCPAQAIVLLDEPVYQEVPSCTSPEC